MSWSLTIAGEAKDLQQGTLRINYRANDRTTAAFEVWSVSGAYSPALDAEVIIAYNGERLLGGLIDKPTRRGISSGAGPGIATAVSVVDFAAYADRRIIVDGGFPAGTTLKAALIALQAWLDPYGVTLDPAQDTGPSLPEINYPLTTVREALDGLVTLTAAAGEPYVWQIDAFKVLRMYLPSSVPAPFDIVSNAPGYVVGDIIIEPSKAGYANRVYVVAAPKEEDGRRESFDGDGTTTTFTLQYTPTTWIRGVVNVDGVDQTLNRPGDADAASWTFDPATNTITSNVGAPGVGTDNVWIEFNGVYSGRAMAQVAEVFTNPWERARTVDNVDSSETLQAIADGDIAQAQLIPNTIKYQTMTQGLKVGQSQLIDVPARVINETGLITDISLFDQVNRLFWQVAVLTGAQTNVGRGWSNTVKNWSAPSTGGGSVSVGASGPPALGPALPDTSIQSNQGGRFYGKASLAFKASMDSIIAGDGCVITAPLVDSCQVFGKNCSIGLP